LLREFVELSMPRSGPVGAATGVGDH